MSNIKTSLQPWLSVPNGAVAETFYKNAFKAIETYRLETPEGGLVIRFSIDGVEFWISEEEPDAKKKTKPLGGETVKLILVVEDPDSFFENALRHGAKEVFAVGEAFGWRLGRLTDPFDLHWEIGRPLSE